MSDVICKYCQVGIGQFDSFCWKCGKNQSEKPTPPVNESWKDRELDNIWHHALKRVQKKEIDVYEALNIIEEQMSKALSTARQEAYVKGYQEGSGNIAADVIALKEQYDKGYSVGYMNGAQNGFSKEKPIDSLTSKGGTNGK